MPVPNEEAMRRMAMAFVRKMRGERPKVYSGGKGIEPANRYERGNFPSSDRANVDFARRNGESMKMVEPRRIYANRWYADPEVQKQYGHQTPVDPQVFKQEFMARLQAPTEYQRELAQRQYDAQVGRQVARQIAGMRQVGPNGILQDPDFIQYQAKVIRDRIFNKGRNGYISGAYTAREQANLEDYLNAVTDDELVRKYPYFFDYETDGAKYLLDKEEQERAVQQFAPVESRVYGKDLDSEALAEYYRRHQGQTAPEAPEVDYFAQSMDPLANAYNRYVEKNGPNVGEQNLLSFEEFKRAVAEQGGNVQQ